MSPEQKQLHKLALDRLLERLSFQEGEKAKEVYAHLFEGAPPPSWAHDEKSFADGYMQLTLPCALCGEEEWVLTARMMDGECLCKECASLSSMYCVDVLEANIQALQEYGEEKDIKRFRQRLSTLQAMDPEIYALGLKLELLEEIRQCRAHGYLQTSENIQAILSACQQSDLITPKQAKAYAEHYEENHTFPKAPYQIPTAQWEALTASLNPSE